MSKVYIDLDLLMEKARGTDAYFAIKSIITGIPAADVEEVKHGEWAHLGGDEWCCTCCGEVIHTEGSWEKPRRKYCEECGAKMPEVPDEY